MPVNIPELVLDPVVGQRANLLLLKLVNLVQLPLQEKLEVFLVVVIP